MCIYINLFPWLPGLILAEVISTGKSICKVTWVLRLPRVLAVLGTEPRSHPASLLFAGLTPSPVWGCKEFGMLARTSPRDKDRSCPPARAQLHKQAAPSDKQTSKDISSPLISWQLPTPGAGKRALDMVPNTHVEMPLLCRCQLPIW